MTKFMINNRTDAWKTEVDLLNRHCATSYQKGFFWLNLGVTVSRYHDCLGWQRFVANFRLRPHYAGRIWKRNNHRPFWICVWGKLRRGNRTIVVTKSCWKSPVFKRSSVHTKTQNRRFQIPPVWRAFSKSSVFVTDQCGGQTVEIKLLV